MDALRRGSGFEFTLSQSDATGLYAVLSCNPTSVTPEQLLAGQTIYTWFFGEVRNLAGAAPLSAPSNLPEEKNRKHKNK